MSVEFEPIRLGSGRRHGNPAQLVALGVAVFLVAGLLKPWERPSQASHEQPGFAVRVPVASVAPSDPVGARNRLLPRGQQPVVTWGQVLDAITPRGEWGVRALVDRRVLDGLIRSRAGRLFERWEPVAASRTGSIGQPVAAHRQAADSVRLPTSDEPVRVLGVTMPDTMRAVGVRVWWIRPLEEPRRLDVRRIAFDESSAQLRLLPPRRMDGTADRWPPGTYRFDVILDDGVIRIKVDLPATRVDPVPPTDVFAPPPAGAWAR